MGYTPGERDGQPLPHNLDCETTVAVYGAKMKEAFNSVGLWLGSRIPTSARRHRWW